MTSFYHTGVNNLSSTEALRNPKYSATEIICVFRGQSDTFLHAERKLLPEA